MFKISKIEKGEPQEGYSKNSSWFELSVEFFNDDKDVHFGHLDKYFKAVAIFEREKYEDYYDNFEKDDMYFEDIEGSESKLLKFKKPSPYELGYCKIIDCTGEDNIQRLGDNKFKYSCFVSSNYITEACIKQLLEMKEHQENSFCRYGNYPDQVGAFRSGDPFHDFLGILETLDRFWD